MKWCLFASLSLFLGTSISQKVLGTAEEMSVKKHTEDTLSVAASVHSSPPASPQGSPRKGKAGQFKLILVTLNTTLLHVFSFSIYSNKLKKGVTLILFELSCFGFDYSDAFQLFCRTPVFKV